MHDGYPPSVSTLARLRHVPMGQLPYRVRQVAGRCADLVRRPPSTPPGASVRWPVDDPPRPDIAQAKRLAAGWSSHGARVTGQPDWQHDPCTGARLPTGPASWLDALALGFDPRPAWELHRLQHLALWAHCDPDADAPAERADAWLALWPMGRGLPWASALEVACRLVSLVRLASVHPHPRWTAAIHAHAAWIAHHPSRGSSEGNHRVAELVAMVLARDLLPRRALRQIAELPDVLDRLVLADGGGAERSVGYLAFTLEWALLARACGVEGLDGALGRGSQFLASIIDAGGNVARIGDSDDGRVVAITPGVEPHYVRSVAGAAAAAVGLPPPVGWAWDARARTLGAPNGSPPHAVPSSRSFPDTGLTVLHDRRAQLIMDHGPVGGAHLGAHGHADTLAIWLHLDGRPVLVGRGTPTYTGDPWRRRIARGSLAQSAVILDGASSSDPHDHPFLWARRASASEVRIDLEAGWVEARHDGFVASHDVRHLRRVRLDADAITVHDTLDGEGLHHVSLLLQLAPDLRVSDDGRVAGPAGELMHVVCPEGLVMEVIRGRTGSAFGWHAPRYGVSVPAPTLMLQGWVQLPVRLCTRMQRT